LVIKESVPLASEPMLFSHPSVSAAHRERDGRQDERVLRHRLAAGLANQIFADTDDYRQISDAERLPDV
jgi:hypothetical protein